MGDPLEAVKWFVSHSDDGTLSRDREPVDVGALAASAALTDHPTPGASRFLHVAAPTPS